MNDDEPKHDGDTYEPEIDRIPLDREGRLVWDIMIDQEWHTDEAMYATIRAQGERCSMTGIAARHRDFRKVKFGAHTVERRRVKGQRLYEYRLIPGRKIPVLQLAVQW